MILCMHRQTVPTPFSAHHAECGRSGAVNQRCERRRLARRSIVGVRVDAAEQSRANRQITIGSALAKKGIVLNEFRSRHGARPCHRLC